MLTIAKKLILLSIFFQVGTVFAQPEKEAIRKQLEDASFNEKFENALNLVTDKVYLDALYIWEILLEEDPENANLHYKAGLCNTYLNREEQAIPYLEKAKLSVNKRYNPTSFLERNAPIEVYYHLAKANHTSGNVDKAKEQYDYFAANANKKHMKQELAVLGQAQVKNATELIANPEPFVIKNLGSQINTKNPDYSPVISIDGSTLFFTSKRLRADSTNVGDINTTNGLYYEDIYVSYKEKDGNWSTPEYLGFCRPRSNDACISSSPDGRTIFVYSDKNGGDIYYSEMKDTVFKQIRPFPADELNSEYFESHATISNDGNYLYFVSNRPGGMGGTDIYRLKKLPNGEWSKAYNLGPTINSAYDEESPFLGVDNKTMYFSSNGSNSIGGFDIFVTQVEEDIWSEPINMGTPLNTVDDDIFYTTTADGKTGYYSSDKAGGMGDKDIYSAFSENTYIQNVAVLKGFINTSDGSKIPSGINITVQDLAENDTPKNYSPRMRDGGYVLTLVPCHTYNLNYTLNGDEFHNSEFYVPCNTSYQELNHELSLDMVSLKGTRILTEEDSIIKERKETGLTCDLVYRVQIGVFKNDIPADYYKRFNPVTTELLADEETRYMLGEFKEYILSEKTRQQVISDYPDSYIVAYLNGIRISTTVGRDLENGVVECDESLFPDVEHHEDSVGTFTEKITVPTFQHNFGYNKNKFDRHDKDFQVFVKGIKEIVDQNLPITIYLTSSSSTVPTSSFKDNQDLAVQRLNNGKATLIALLKEYNVDISKVNIVLKEASINGPAYNNDASKNRRLYKNYQYIKFDIKF